MQIAYCYIEDYINIEHQQINFGSPYIFQTIKDKDEFVISRKLNPHYVNDLFRRKSDNRVDNISAIVGQNGAGKTNLIHFLLNALPGNAENIYGFLLLADRHGRVRLLNRCSKNIKYDFEIEEIENYKDFASIYYNPIYDFQDHYGSAGSQLIDVSSNHLIENDYAEDEFFSESMNPFSYHKYKNVSRQVRFLVSQKNAQIINRYIPIPKQIEVVFIEPKLGHSEKSLDNVSYEFRPFYQIGIDIWRKEKDQLHSEKKKAKDRLIKPRFDKQMAYLDALFYTWKYIFYTQELNNSTLAEGQVGYSQRDYEELKGLSFEMFIRRFLGSQNIFSGSSITGFIDSIKLLTKKVKRVDEGKGNVRFFCTLSQVEDVLNKYDAMVGHLSKLLYQERPNGLVQFNWRSMSSGERAFLDLFARMHFAVEEINRQLGKSERETTPRYIYLFFDEAELGFHLQWQKEYIKILLEIIPRIFRFNMRIYPHIQLIFTTHSPISLSDIPRYNTVYLSQDSDFKMNVHSAADSPKFSFGANVHEIMYDAFYLRNGFTGMFSKEVIDELFAWAGDSESPADKLSQVYVRNAINLIDDPILRVKLEELYAKKTGQNAEEAVLVAKIKFMERRLNEIRKQDDTDL